MKKKLLAAMLCVAMAATSLVGCGGSGDSGKDTDTAKSSEKGSDEEKVELTIWETSRNKDDWYTSMEKKFLEEHPNITLNKVVKEGDPGNEFYQAVASGTAPDLVNCSFTMMDSYITSGILEPLNQYTDEWDEWGNFTKEYVDMFTKDGKVYGVPNQVAPMLFGYNKALFEEAGIKEPPKTWDEAVEVAKKINDPDNQVAGYATLAAEWTEWFFQYYVWQAGGDLTKENEDGTAELTFTDPAVIKAAEYYQKLKSEGVLQSDLTLKFSDLVTNFGLGKIGMMPFAGDWVSEAITKGIDPDDIGLCLPPAGPSGKQTTAIGGDCWVINAKADQAKKDAAWEYIKYYTGKDYRTSYFENLATKGAPNPVIIPRDDMSITDFYEFPEEYKEVLESAKSVGRLEFYGKADFGSYVDRAVQKILTDSNADPETEFAEAQKLCEKEALEKFNEANQK
ncbi:extracellular solute-binding protein [Mediterraneibacter gnavus]|uniref:extracellular solute-binding protein n=1 Tax=Mediterraneibacter gnavus TaxID=33038 RepID=UPI00366CD313